MLVEINKHNLYENKYNNVGLKNKNNSEKNSTDIKIEL